MFDTVFHKDKRYVCMPGRYFILETLAESIEDQRKLHFVSQKHLKGEFFVKRLMKKAKLSPHEASQAISRIKIQFWRGALHMKGSEILVQVQLPQGEMQPIMIGRLNTVHDLKAMIHDERGIGPGDQVLTYGSQTLKETETLESCGIKDKSLINCDVSNKGGGGFLKRLFSARGAIVPGADTVQEDEVVDFAEDPEFYVKPFYIELCLASEEEVMGTREI